MWWRGTLARALEQVQPVQALLRVGRANGVSVVPLVIVVGASIQVERHAGAPDVAVIPLDALEAHIKGQPEELALVEVCTPCALRRMCVRVGRR